MQTPSNKLFKDISGQRFGKLTVTKYFGVKYPDRNTRGHQWLCRCDCGNEKVIFGSSLKSGNTTSCGCSQKEKIHKRLIDIVGNKYGKLVVVKYDFTKNGNVYWLCKCDCGNEKIIAGNSLKAGKTKSCGCRQGNLKHGLSSNKTLYKKHRFLNPIIKLQHNVSCSVRDAIKSRNGNKKGKTFQHLPYTAKQLKEHLESQFEHWMNWENYGGTNNTKEKTWHIDHIVPHSKFPYKSLDDPLFHQCWCLLNLRPLEKIENIRKNNA